MSNYRDFTHNGVKFSICSSNNSGWKWQLLVLEKGCWIRCNEYANTIQELKDRIKYGC